MQGDDHCVLIMRDSMDIVQLTDDNFVRSVKNALRFGKPLLIENVSEELDPILDPVLQKQICKQRLFIYNQFG